MGLGNLIFILLFSCASWGNLLVVEYKEPGQDSHHEDTVKHIACGGVLFSCELYATEDFLSDFRRDMFIKLSKFDVVNMSLSFQKPEFEAPKGEVADFVPQRDNLSNTIYENSHVLFVVAAGNGFELGFLALPSVPLVDHYKVYPASFEGENLIKVTAVKEQGLSFEELEVKTLGERVNYGVELVDVAAVVELNHLGEIFIQTSTATPHVARLATLIKRKHSVFSPRQIKEIIMKTVYVKNIDRVLEIEEDFLVNKTESLLEKLRLEKNYFKREEIRKEIGDILLVKSGGTVVPEVAMLCAKIYEQAIGLLSIEQSCLEAQKEKLYLNVVREKKLRKLWGFRGF